MKEPENQADHFRKGTCSQLRIWLGELMPWCVLCIMVGILLVCRRWPCREGFDLWSLVLIPVYGLLVWWLFGRNLSDNPSLLSMKEHIRNGMVLVVCAGSFLCGYFGITLLVIGVTVIVVAASCLACVNSWLFRFRGGRMIGLFVLFLIASILYHKLELKTEHCGYEKNAMVEPIHIANQLVGVALPSRGHLGEDGSTLKPLLYEGCHFFIWVFVFSLAISFSNRELVNRLYLKLTRFKPMYVFWSSEGDSAEESVANDIARKSRLFKPNIVLAIWGKGIKDVADVCDKWKRGRRWVEAMPAEYDDVLSYADVHYILSSDGMSNVKKAVELLRQVKRGKIYVRLDNVPDSIQETFRQYVLSLQKPHVSVFSVLEDFLVQDQINTILCSSGPVFVVNYCTYKKDCDINDEALSKSECAFADWLAEKIVRKQKLSSEKKQALILKEEKFSQLSKTPLSLICCGRNAKYLIEVVDAIVRGSQSEIVLYVYTNEVLLAEMLRGRYNRIRIIGLESDLFTEDTVYRDSRRFVSQDMLPIAPCSSANA